MIFVTGGTGLIGSHLLFELLASGRRVVALKRETSHVDQVLRTFSYYTDQPEKLFQCIEWADGDMLDYYRMEDLLDQMEEVYHCAAIISFRPGDRQQMIRNNREGTANLVNAALKNRVGKFCHVSSVAALGPDMHGSLTTENSTWVPSKKITGYSESKFYSEMEVWRGIEEGLNAVVINPSIVLGPGFWDNGSSRFFKTIWKGMRFYPRGVTGFVDVKDVTKAMVMLMDSERFETTRNQRFLLNGGNYSYQELFNQIADALNKERPSYYASQFLLQLAWRGAALYGLLSGKAPALTRETATAANQRNGFDGNKITRTIHFEYTPLGKTIEQTAKILLQEMHKG